MEVVERLRNESVKVEESSREGPVICYKRKRASSSADSIQVDMPSRKERIKDIGWDHGTIVDGNRFQWMCKWCGLVRYGGGVSRLKKHLAGVYNVRKCPKVPKHISKEIMNHLIEKQKLREKRSVARNGNKGRRQNHSPHGHSVDKAHIKSDMEMQVGSTNQLSREATQQSNVAIQQLNITTQQTTGTTGLTGMTKAIAWVRLFDNYGPKQ